jgi:hypothetical protein
VLGVAINKYNALNKYGFLTDNRTRLLKYIAVLAVSFTALLFTYRLKLTDFANLSAISQFASYSVFLVVKTALVLLFALLAFCLARIIVVSSSKASRPPSRAIWYRALLLISFSSYAIYLFFGCILVPLMHALIGTNITRLRSTSFRSSSDCRRSSLLLICYKARKTKSKVESENIALPQCPHLIKHKKSKISN